MSEINKILDRLDRKFPDGFEAGSAKFDVTGVGTVILDAGGVRESNSNADVTLCADAQTFQGILEGDVNPTVAYMSGKLKVDGDMSLALTLAGKLG